MFTALLIYENKVLFLPATNSMIFKKEKKKNKEKEHHFLAEGWEYCSVYSASPSFSKCRSIVIFLVGDQCLVDTG